MSRTILVVDDEENLVRLLEVNLQRSGYEVLKAFNGNEALAIARDKRPDIILLDVNMPTMGGYEALAAVKADPDIKNTPVIMLTANRLAEDLEQSLSKGAEYHVTKPIDFVELNGLLERFWQGRE